MIKFVAMTLEFYDILQNLIYGVDYDGLQMMPVPLIVPIALAASAGIQAYKGWKDKQDGLDAQKAGEDAAKKAKLDFDKYTRTLRELGQQKRNLQGRAYDIAGTRRTMAEAQEQGLRDQLGRVEAGVLQNLQSTSAGRGGNVTALLNELSRQKLEAGAAVAGQKLQADADLFAQEQAVDDANFMREFEMEKFLGAQGQELALSDRERGFAAAEAGRLEAAAGQNAMFDAGTQLATSLIGAYGTPTAVPQGSSLVYPNQIPIPPVPEEADGGSIKKAKVGAAIKTPGAFDHATNPLAVFMGEAGMTIEDKRGEEVAEVTGQEIMVEDKEDTKIFNPEQQVSMQELIDKGDEKGLFKYIKKLLEEFEKDAEAHEEMKEQNV